VQRVVLLTGKQWLGVPLLAAPPILALCGVLGPGRAGIVERALNREHVTPEEIEAAARLAGIDRLASVHLATLEADGKISIIRR
jgi:uncharacterized protein DUF421